jgi:hypothetical protein
MIKLLVCRIAGQRREALENAYPFRVERYALRTGSGGEGRMRGGAGVERDYRILTDDICVSLSSARQVRPAQGFDGPLLSLRRYRLRGLQNADPQQSCGEKDRGTRLGGPSDAAKTLMSDKRRLQTVEAVHLSARAWRMPALCLMTALRRRQKRPFP